MIRLLFTSGRGPAECRMAVAGVLEVLVREAQAAGLDVDVVEGSNPDGAGPYSAIAVIHGVAGGDFARGWAGSIQWIAQSPVRPHHKRKNWFIGVSRLPERQALPQRLAANDVRFETFRAGGPGGQHQNKTESAVRATHVPTGLAVVAREERSQHRNKAAALERLAALLETGRELQAITDKQDVQTRHDSLERGSPVRRFKGQAFKPE
jgi:peptide chain release factor